jgi:hypothetical protein
MSKSFRGIVTGLLVVTGPLALAMPGCAGRSKRLGEETAGSAGNAGSVGSAGKSSGGGAGGAGAATHASGGNSGGAPQPDQRAGSGGRGESGGEAGVGFEAGRGGDSSGNGGRGGLGGTDGSEGGMNGEGGCEQHGASELECTLATTKFCAMGDVLGCPSTFENVRRTQAICSAAISESGYEECDGALVSFWWEVQNDWDPDLASYLSEDTYALQFSKTTHELLFGEVIDEHTTEHQTRTWAGVRQSRSGCRSCRICAPVVNGNAGAPGTGGQPDSGEQPAPSGPSDLCRFDSKGRISLPPLE